MKFYKFETNHTQTQFDKIVLKMTLVEAEQVEKLFKNIDCIEYTNKLGNECLFASLNDSDFRIICELYDRYSIKFDFLDLTESVLFDLPIDTKFKNSNGSPVSLKIKRLMKNYRKNWLNSDVVLDKILALGIKSLNELDYTILKRH